MSEGSEWYKINEALSNARREALKSLGHTEGSYRKLEKTTVDYMNEHDLDLMEVEGGKIQKVQTCIYKTKAESGIVGYKDKLHRVRT